MALKGKERLLKQLRGIPKEVIEEAHKALRLNAEEHAQHVRQIVPTKSGKLKRSIRVVFQKGPLKVHVLYGDEDAFYAAFVEQGTKAGRKGTRTTNSKGRTRLVYRNHPGTRARPVFFAMYRAYKRKYKSRLARHINKGMKKALSKS